MRNKGNFLRLASTLMMIIAASACARPVATATPPGLTVKILYPTAGETRKMGQSLKPIVQVLDAQGVAVMDAQVTVTVIDASENVILDLTAAPGSGDVYRTTAWSIPHRMQAGTWSVRVQAQ